MSEKRDKTLDILKGIAILFMVMGHASSPITNFIYMFHMALFFICSGIFFKEKYYNTKEDIIYFIKSKVNHLYIPFVLWNGFLILIHNFLLKINIYTNNPDFIYFTKNEFYGVFLKASSFGLIQPYSFAEMINKILSVFCFCEEVQLGEPTWFLKVLFWISLFSVFIHFVLKIFIKNIVYFKIIRLIIYISLLLTGFLCQKYGYNFYHTGTMFSCAILYYFGILYGIYKEKINEKFLIFSGILSFIGLYFSCYYSGYTDLVKNTYPGIFFLIFNSLTGFIFVLCISKIICKFRFLSNFLSYMGKHTISILCFHYIGFKIIIYIQILLCFKTNSYLLASFPILTPIKGWWILYTVAGISVPLIIVFVWEKIKKLALNNNKNNI